MSALSVEADATISRHPKLGEVGETGLAQGSHLHLEIWSSGSRPSNVDPYRLVHAAPLAGSVGGNDVPDITDMEEEAPAVVYVAEGHVPVLAIGAKFWSISRTEAGSALDGGVPQVWLTTTSLEGLIADSRSSKTRGAAPLLIRVTGVGLIYVAHGGAVRLQNEDEVTNLKTKFEVREVRLSSQLADLIVNDLRNNTNG